MKSLEDSCGWRGGRVAVWVHKGGVKEGAGLGKGFRT